MKTCHKIKKNCFFFIFSRVRDILQTGNRLSSPHSGYDEVKDTRKRYSFLTYAFVWSLVWCTWHHACLTCQSLLWKKCFSLLFFFFCSPFIVPLLTHQTPPPSDGITWKRNDENTIYRLSRVVCLLNALQRKYSYV